MVEDRGGERLYVILAVAVFGAGILSRLILASEVQHPGHADYSYYYTVAENLADRGKFEIDYLWHFLGDPRSITHPSNDYWMPLASIIVSASMLALGKSLFAALLPSMLAAVLLSAVTYAGARMLTGSRPVALGSACVVFVLPELFAHSLRPEGTVFYSLFASSSLLLAIKGWRAPKFFVPAIALAALAQLTRQDGALLVAALFALLLGSPNPRRTRFSYAIVALSLYGAILSPLVIANYRTFGAPSPPGPYRTAFLTHYEDLYAPPEMLTLRRYLDWGFANIIGSKLRAAAANAYTLYRTFGDFLGVFTVLGAWGIVRRRDGGAERTMWGPPLIFLALLFASYSVLFGFPSSFERSSLALAPFATVLAVDALRRIVAPRACVFILAMLAGSLFIQSVQLARTNIATDAAMHEELREVKRIVSDDAAMREDDDVVIMTRNPWELHHSTRFKAIQIPNASLESICETARRFGADYVILPAPREALEDIYSGARLDGRFEFLGAVPHSDLRIFRFDSEGSP